MRLLRARVCLALALASVAGCAAPAPPAPPPPIAQPPTAAASLSPSPVATPSLAAASRPSPPPAVAPRPAGSPSPLALPLSVVVGRSGSDLRVALNLLLQEHVYLSGAAVDASAAARLDELTAAASTLDENALNLAEVVGGYKGQAAASAFLSAWRAQTAAVLRYAAGGPDQAAARAELDAQAAASADQLALDSFSPSVAQDLIQRHVQGLLSAADAFGSSDTGSAVQALRADAATADDLARPLTAVIAARAPDQVPAPTEGPEIDLRVTLTRLFQEHLYLTGLAEQAAAARRDAESRTFSGAADSTATAFGQQLADLYGASLANQVADDLRRETAACLQAAVGSGGGGRQQAVDALEAIRTDLDAHLSGANALLPRGLVSSELRASDQKLLTAADAFGAQDWATGLGRAREAARLGQKLADSLAMSTIDRFPAHYLVSRTPTPAA